MNDTVLVVGATGRIGRHLVGDLIERDVAVRVLTRDPARASQVLGDRIRRVDVVRGDLADTESVKAAVSGADRVFLVVGGPACTDEKHELNVVRALIGKATKLVKVSGGFPVTSEQSSSPIGAAHWRCEREIISSSLDFTILRPSLFSQNTLNSVSDGHIFLTDIDMPVSYVDARDIALVAMAALLDSGHERKIYEVTGDEAIDSESICATIQRVCRNPLKRTVHSTDWVLQRTPPWYRSHVREVHRMMRAGAYAKITDAVKTVTGRNPTTFDQFVQNNADWFRRRSES